jgi:hypothetical protein
MPHGDPVESDQCHSTSVLIVRATEQLRQLRDVRRNPPSFVPNKQRALSTPRALCAGVVCSDRPVHATFSWSDIILARNGLAKGKGVVMVFDGPGRREAARGSGHTTEGPLSLPLLLRSCFMLAIAQVMASASCRCSGRKYPALTSFAIISFGKGTTSLISQVRAFVDRHWGRGNLCAKRQTSGRRLRPPAMKEIQKTRWARSGVEVGFMRGIGDIIEIMKVVPVVALELQHRKRLKPGKSNTQTHGLRPQCRRNSA